MAGNLGVDPDVVERASRDCRDDVTRVGTRGCGRAIVTALAGRDGSDDQPYQQNEPTDSHFYLRKTGSSYSSEELRTRDVSLTTPHTADTRPRRLVYNAHLAISDTRTGLFPAPVYRVC
jgi:hypothetical protein